MISKKTIGLSILGGCLILLSLYFFLIDKGPLPAKQPRLVILYATCSLNKQCVAPFGPEVSYTPNIDRFASKGAVFKNYQVECGNSGIAYASLFSGSQADVHGIFTHPRRMGDDIFLITEAFAQSGYDVFFWGGHTMASYDLNYGQGTPPDQAFPHMLRDDSPVFRDILNRLNSDKNYKAFIVTNFTVTHAIYPPVDINCISGHGKTFQLCGDRPALQEEFKKTGLTLEDFERFHGLLQQQDMLELSCNFEGVVKALNLSETEKEKFIRAINFTYKVDVSRLDALFGGIVNKINQRHLLNESLIAFTADHGEVLYRDNAIVKYNHGYQLAPEVLSVPLIIAGPGSGVHPATYDFVVRSIDVFPTMAGLCGVSIPEEATVQGVDLSEVLRGNKNYPTLPAYAHTVLLHKFMAEAVWRYPVGRAFYPAIRPDLMWVSVRHGDDVFKIAKFDIGNPVFAPAVFDLVKDPEERKNLYDPLNTEHRRVMDDLIAYKEKLTAACQRSENIDPGVSTKEIVNRLKSLGYL